MLTIPAMLWIAVPVLVLAHAALCDVRTREVPDAHWAVMGVAGIVLCAMSTWDGDAVAAVCRLAASAILLVSMLWEGVDGPRSAASVAVAAIVLLIPYATGHGGPEAAAGLSSLVMFLLFYGMYLTGLLRGGADAKCLMTVALVFPMYPETGALPLLWEIGYPESLVMNPSFSVMVLALLLSLLGCVRVAAINVRDGRVDGRMFTSYVTDENDVDGNFVWSVPDGDLPDDKARVTPMVPFVLPAAVSAAVVTVLGSPLALLLT